MQTDQELFDLIKETYPLDPSDAFVLETDAKLRQMARNLNRKRKLKRFSLASSGFVLCALAISWFFFFSGKEAVTKSLSSLNENNSSSAVNEQEPLVYIYQTHNQESFLPEMHVSEPNEAFDKTKNITLVSARLSQALKEKNINVINESKDVMGILKEKGLGFDKSYQVSREALADVLEEHKSIKMVFDLHRDSRKRDQTTIAMDGKDYARIVFVVSGLSKNYQENVKFATSLHNSMEKKYPGLSRGVIVKSSESTQSAYNQDLLNGSVLLEIGGVENTLEEEYRTADVFAGVVKEVME